MKKSGFGVIGLGEQGQHHVRVYAQHPSADLVAVCDTNADLTKKTASEYKTRGYTDYHDMLEDPKLDVVSVVTPDFLHRDPVVAAIEAGKHVLCEKPLAMTVRDAEEMVSAAEKAGVTLGVSFHNRFNPYFALTKEAVDKGELGEPVHAYLRLSGTRRTPKHFKWFSKSSVLWFLGSHITDLVRWIFNDEADQVYAVSWRKILAKTGVDTPDFYQYLIQFRNGPTAVLENSYVLPNTLPALDFIADFAFTEGCIHISPDMNGGFRKLLAETWSFPNTINKLTIHGVYRGFVKESISYFVDSIVKGREHLSTGRDGLAVTKILCAVEESVKKGRPVKIL